MAEVQFSVDCLHVRLRCYYQKLDVGVPRENQILLVTSSRRSSPLAGSMKKVSRRVSGAGTLTQPEFRLLKIPYPLGGLLAKYYEQSRELQHAAIQ